NGVISADAGSGSGNTTDHISCNSPNGDSATQALSICTNIKQQNIILYTVGFDMQLLPQSATDLLGSCATDPSHAYIAATGSDLITAFQAIAQSINNLRISQ